MQSQCAAPRPRPPTNACAGNRWFGHMLNRPEFAAISGAVLVFVVFGVAAGSSGMFNLDGVMNWRRSPPTSA